MEKIAQNTIQRIIRGYSQSSCCLDEILNKIELLSE